MHRGGGLLKPALGDGEGALGDLQIDADLGGAAGMGAERLGLLVGAAVGLEEQRLQRDCAM